MERRFKHEHVLVALAGAIAFVLLLLWTRPPYAAFYTAWLPYDVRNEIVEGKEEDTYAAFNGIINLLRRASRDESLLETEVWHLHWRANWLTVYENARGNLQGVAATCIRYGETKLTADLLVCIEQARALRE
jgi:hypothetical protein